MAQNWELIRVPWWGWLLLLFVFGGCLTWLVVGLFVKGIPLPG
jgi:hypothetical protein